MRDPIEPIERTDAVEHEGAGEIGPPNGNPPEVSVTFLVDTIDGRTELDDSGQGATIEYCSQQLHPGILPCQKGPVTITAGGTISTNGTPSSPEVTMVIDGYLRAWQRTPQGAINYVNVQPLHVQIKGIPPSYTIDLPMYAQAIPNFWDFVGTITGSLQYPYRGQLLTYEGKTSLELLCICLT